MKKLGYTNIKLYNGGLKDWQKAGHPVDSIEPLPDYQGKFIIAEELLTRFQQADIKGCGTADDPSLTILDLRVLSVHRKEEDQVPDFITICPVLRMLSDDLRNQANRDQISKQGLVVLIDETGNRAPWVMRYLFKVGYTNVAVLKFGMRGWIKLGYPITTGND